MDDYMVTITPRNGALRISAFEIEFGGGNTTGSRVATETVPRFDTFENMVKDFVFRHLGHSFDIRQGDVGPSLFIVTVYDV